MKNTRLMHVYMGRVCKRGHLVAENNAIPKRIAGKIYTQCRQCANATERERKRFLRDNPQLMIKNNRTEQMSMS